MKSKEHIRYTFINVKAALKKYGRKGWGLAKPLLFIVLLVNMWQYFGVYGLLAGAAGFTILIIVFRWESYKMVMQHTETKIWGEPMEKAYWKKKKIPKVKIVWRKKKHETKR